MKTILISLFVSTLLLFSQSCDYIGAGSYPYAEVYSTGYSRDNVISAVQVFKAENPNISLPNNCPEIDGYSKDTNNNDITAWYYSYFYYPDKKTFITTFINKNGEIGFIGIGLLTDCIFQNARRVNKDIKGSENAAVKEEFVTRILNPINEILKRK